MVNQSKLFVLFTFIVLTFSSVAFGHQPGIDEINLPILSEVQVTLTSSDLGAVQPGAVLIFSYAS